VGTPIVGSEAIPWLSSLSQADPLTIDGIEDTIDNVINNFRNNAHNFRNLTEASEDAEKAWLRTLR
jgi:hypothetical protein